MHEVLPEVTHFLVPIPNSASNWWGISLLDQLSAYVSDLDCVPRLGA